MPESKKDYRGHVKKIEAVMPQDEKPWALIRLVIVIETYQVSLHQWVCNN